MSQLRDGAHVDYIGEGDDKLAIGDRGIVMSVGRTGSHVQWRTGSRSGEIYLTPNYDLVLHRSKKNESEWSSGLEGPLVTVAVANVFDRSGALGLLNAMSEEGHLAVLDIVAEETMDFIAARLRQDPSFQSVLGQLEPEDGEEVIRVASRLVYRDIFGS